MPNRSSSRRSTKFCSSVFVVLPFAHKLKFSENCSHFLQHFLRYFFAAHSQSILPLLFLLWMIIDGSNHAYVHTCIYRQFRYTIALRSCGDRAQVYAQREHRSSDLACILAQLRHNMINMCCVSLFQYGANLCIIYLCNTYVCTYV